MQGIVFLVVGFWQLYNESILELPTKAFDPSSRVYAVC